MVPLVLGVLRIQRSNCPSGETLRHICSGPEMIKLAWTKGAVSKNGLSNIVKRVLQGPDERVVKLWIQTASMADEI